LAEKLVETVKEGFESESLSSRAPPLLKRDVAEEGLPSEAGPWRSTVEGECELAVPGVPACSSAPAPLMRVGEQALYCMHCSAW